MRWPFGGLPIGGVFLGQAGGPVLGVARLGGPLGPDRCRLRRRGRPGRAGRSGGAGPCGTGPGPGAFARVGPGGRLAGDRVGAAVGGGGRRRAPGDLRGGGPGRRWSRWRRWRPTTPPTAARPVGTVTTAAVQGGGARGFRKSQIDPAVVLAAQHGRHPAAPAPGPRHRTQPGALARGRGVPRHPPARTRPRRPSSPPWPAPSTPPWWWASPRPSRPTAFRNEIVAWGPDGTLVARFEKVHRVPFGEYVPSGASSPIWADLSARPARRRPRHRVRPAGHPGRRPSGPWSPTRSSTPTGAGPRYGAAPSC